MDCQIVMSLLLFKTTKRNLNIDYPSVATSLAMTSTADLEAEIDKLVYGLYGLTGEEIGIIEQSIK